MYDLHTFSPPSPGNVDTYDEEDEAPEDEYLTFTVAAEQYALAVHHVAEIIAFQRITLVPNTPAYIQGVINLRGQIIPVVDVRLRFGLPTVPYHERTCIIIAEGHDALVGLIVEAVSEVCEIPDSDIIAPPSTDTGTQGRFIQGLCRMDSGVKLILNPDTLLEPHLQL